MIARAWHVLGHEGALALMYRMLGETVYRRLLLFETELSASPFEPDARCRWLGADETEAYTQANPELSVDEYRRRYRTGLRCWAMIAPDGRIMHALWVATGSAIIDYLGYACPLAPPTRTCISRTRQRSSAGSDTPPSPCGPSNTRS